MGIIKPTHSPFNSPVWPVKKPDGSWCMTVDYRELNKVTPPLHAAVPSLAVLRDTLSHELGMYHYVVDLANAFFSIHITQESQEQFVFTWEVWQWTFTVLPQGYLHSPTICHGPVAQDLVTWKKPQMVQLCHYIDDIMLMSDSLADLEGAVPRLLQHLQEKGWAVNSTKVQGPGLSVKFLAVVWLIKTKVIPEAVTDKV